MHNIISAHNKHILNSVSQPTDIKNKECNCRQKEKCPLDGNCQASSIVYQATVTPDDTNEEQTYVVLTENNFKTRYLNHTSSFTNEKQKHATELSKNIWRIKEHNVNHTIKWRILKRCKPYSNTSKRCDLCLHEKYVIICQPKISSLYRKNELISSCRHRKKYLLSNTSLKF